MMSKTVKSKPCDILLRNMIIKYQKKQLDLTMVTSGVRIWN